MCRLTRAFISSILAGLFVAGCGNSVAVPGPTAAPSPTPPVVTTSGSLAVVNRANSAAKRVWVFPPHSDRFAREYLIHGSRYEINSLAFDRAKHLYIGINDTASGGKYDVVEVNLEVGGVIRDIEFPQWSYSSVATDDESNLYVNTKSFVGGDVKIFRNDTATKPYLEIKDPASPLTTLVTRNALSIGYEGFAHNLLTRYRLRSTDRTWLKTIGSDVPLALAENGEGSLVAAFVKLKSGRAVQVIDVKSGNVARTLVEGPRLVAFTGDGSDHVYIAESIPGQSGDAKIHVCNFRGCIYSIDTTIGRPLALAVSPVDRTLYVSFSGKNSVVAYDPKTGKQVRIIIQRDLEPTALAIEP